MEPSSHQYLQPHAVGRLNQPRSPCQVSPGVRYNDFASEGACVQTTDGFSTTNGLDSVNCGPYCIAVAAHWVMSLRREQYFHLMNPPQNIDPARVRQWLRLATTVSPSEDAPVPDFATESERPAMVSLEEMLSKPWVRRDESDDTDDSSESVCLVSESGGGGVGSSQTERELDRDDVEPAAKRPRRH